MVAPLDGLAAALQRLEALGFLPVCTLPSRRQFEGFLNCDRGPVRIRFEIVDWDFVAYPTITLLEWPAFFPELMPHVAADRSLCYFAEGSVLLDRYRPDAAVWRCLEQARLVLNQSVENPQYYSDEFRGEFWANWNIAQLPIAISGLVGRIDRHVQRADCYWIGPESALQLFVSNSLEEATNFCASLGWPEPRSSGSCWIFRTTQMPAVPASGLPRTVRDLFQWLKAWDPKLYRAVQETLEEKDYLAWSRCEVVIQSPVGWIGAGFTIDSFKAKAYRRRPSEYRNYLHRAGAQTPIERRVFRDVSSQYVYGRNLTGLHQSLAGKRIAVVGCGAIGGYLASALVRLGAGTEGGLLHLIDIDRLFPDNLGRHRLGYDHLFENKAEALCEVLARESPFAQITSSKKNVTSGFPGGFGLLIDATGEEAVSEAINAQHLTSSIDIPVLHVWVYGNGDCVQGLWVDSHKRACYRCLRHHNEAEYGNERFPLTDEETARAFVGCHAFTPYAVSAPISAAALASDFVADWLRGDVSPRFRLRYSESSVLRRFKSQDVTPLDGCPACRPR